MRGGRNHGHRMMDSLCLALHSSWGYIHISHVLMDCCSSGSDHILEPDVERATRVNHSSVSGTNSCRRWVARLTRAVEWASKGARSELGLRNINRKWAGAVWGWAYFKAYLFSICDSTVPRNSRPGTARTLSAVLSFRVGPNVCMVHAGASACPAQNVVTVWRPWSRTRTSRRHIVTLVFSFACVHITFGTSESCTPKV